MTKRDKVILKSFESTKIDSAIAVDTEIQTFEVEVEPFLYLPDLAIDSNILIF